MRKIPVSSLKTGMSFSEPVYIEGNNLLVPAGIAIRKKDLEHLRSWNIDTVFGDGNVISTSSTGTAGLSAPKGEPKEKAKGAPKGSTPKKDISLGEGKEGIYQAYISLIKDLDLILADIKAGKKLGREQIDPLTEALLQALGADREQIIGFILGGGVSGYELAKSSVNTAILSALTAQELKLPEDRISQVVTGALLHDVGMLRLSQDILDKQGGLSDTELHHIQSHPLHSYRIINKELSYDEDLATTAMQHHERWDGDGYPRHTAGKDINLGARIISVADAFEAMVSKKPYRDPILGYQAMKNLLSDNSRRFDPTVLKAFIQTMGIYPIGSIILLNNGTVGRVVEVQKQAPLRPKIEVIIDDEGHVVFHSGQNTVDLLEEKNLFIARALDFKELARKN